MALPFFYLADLPEKIGAITLDEPTSKHIVQVLRMKTGEKIQLTNGKGLAAVAEIVNPNKKNAVVTIGSNYHEPIKCRRKIGIAISPVKNVTRFEWFLEKVTELGVSDIYPLRCARTERAHFRFERMNAICISAMLQSQQTWLPTLHQPVNFDELAANSNANPEQGLPHPYKQKWIAHCTEQEKRQLSFSLTETIIDGLILIGPEGDFTNEEINSAINNGYEPVALGDTRLRTETAGIVAASLLLLC